MAKSTSPLIDKYLETLKEVPNSRVFAPLAELYRKMGLIDQALSVLKDGITHNPSYVLGYLSLAECYLDSNEKKMAYATLKPLAKKNRDNIRLQKLFAHASYELGYYEESLESYKYLLFFNSRNTDIAAKVKKLEEYLSISSVEESEEKKSERSSRRVLVEKISESKSKDSFNINNLQSNTVDDTVDSWVQMDLTKSTEEGIDDGKVNHSQQDEEEKTFNIDEHQRKKDKVIDFWKVDLLAPVPAEEDCKEVVEENSSAFLTFSMADLYIKQKLYDKAKVTLEKMLSSDLENKDIIERIHSLDDLILKDSGEDNKIDGEQEDDLMKAFDKKIKKVQKKSKTSRKEKLKLFLNLTHKKASEEQLKDNS